MGVDLHGRSPTQVGVVALGTHSLTMKALVFPPLPQYQSYSREIFVLGNRTQPREQQAGLGGTWRS